MACVSSHHRSARSRDAVTLIELLLVMAMIVIITGLTLPTFFSGYKKQQLRSAADQLRVDLAQARNRAMSSGLTLGLTISERTYLISVAADLADENEASTSTPSYELTQELPEGIKLAPVSTTGAATGQPTSGALDPTASSEVFAYFYPDGTTSTVEFQVSNEKQDSLIVSLRGLTGVALVQDAPSQTQGQIVAEIPAAQGGTTP
jgi:Tfp pilus assembly protein FimT